MRIKTFWDICYFCWLGLFFHRKKQRKLLNFMNLKLPHKLIFLSHNFQHFHPFSLQTLRKSVAYIHPIHTRQAITVYAAHKYSRTLTHHSHCNKRFLLFSAVLFSKLRNHIYHRLSVAVSHKAPQSQTSSSPHRLCGKEFNVGSQPFKPSTQPALLFSNLCFPQGCT